jgi:hypothetical protein
MDKRYVLTSNEYHDVLDYRSRKTFKQWREGFSDDLSQLEIFAIRRGNRRRLKKLLCPDCAHEFGAREVKACPQCGSKECYVPIRNTASA